MTGNTDGRPGAVLDEETRADALDVLTDALQWRLTEPRWAAIRTAVDELALGLRTQDVDAVRAAVGELELLGPVRAIPIGREPVLPPPDLVREEINELVHALDDEPEPSS